MTTAILPAIQCDHGTPMLETCRECEAPCPDCGESGPCAPSCHTQTDYEEGTI